MFKWLTRLFGPPSSYRVLVKRVMGDEATADRLIDYEIKRAPGLSREDAIRRAIERLEYERTR